MKPKRPARLATIADVDARVERLAEMTAASFAEVHEKIDDRFNGLQAEMYAGFEEMRGGFEEMRQGFRSIRDILQPIKIDVADHDVEITDLRLRVTDAEKKLWIKRA